MIVKLISLSTLYVLLTVGGLLLAIAFMMEAEIKSLQNPSLPSNEIILEMRTSTSIPRHAY